MKSWCFLLKFIKFQFCSYLWHFGETKKCIISGLSTWLINVARQATPDFPLSVQVCFKKAWIHSEHLLFYSTFFATKNQFEFWKFALFLKTSLLTIFSLTLRGRTEHKTKLLDQNSINSLQNFQPNFCFSTILRSILLLVSNSMMARFQEEIQDTVAAAAVVVVVLNKLQT